MIDCITKALGANLEDQGIAAFFDGLSGLTKDNAHMATGPILSVVGSRPDMFAVGGVEAARRALGGLYETPKIAKAKDGGVGTELSKLIPEWATQFKGGCGCKDMAKKMDDRGVNWCEANSLSIVAHLLSQSEHLIPAFKLVPVPVKKIVAERLLRKAITNAKENHES